MAGRFNRRDSASSAHIAVGMPTTGMHPMANPSASVNARRLGEMPCRTHSAAFRLIEAIDLLIVTLTLSVRRTEWISSSVNSQ
jgi:hypothetical protein